MGYKKTVNKERVKKNKIIQFIKRRYILVTSILLSIAFIFAINLYLQFQMYKYEDIASSEAIQLAESMESLLHPEHISALSASIED